ncbi:MerR family DNA-binding transcriptional regulator [Radiobacillus deserti]|uniref:MerR family DNA-binding transcriptional regulator n=1 Tax=Radiobacillus deserti TaxID=2594883 RepID=A0A516KIH8_9BACI|nr:MerR family DNA-binding transcriptional regulator [Radiobacillus deserti]QDP41181.1 MerR family DNA-binding transcriptional regulator [Radiobacillus deserti]
MTMEKKYSIGEFAKLTGITERTLPHYDQIQLRIHRTWTSGV